ncbi:MAG: hypothetical protein PHT45_07195 [Bacteroidales bacterium]|nr:hypothetical protein [Bacteroidales bacterium]
MDIQVQKLNCDKCGNIHEIELDFDLLTENQKKGIEPILNNFICPDIYLMYKVLGFAFDTRVNSLKPDIPKKQQEHVLATFKHQWGESDFDKKIERYIKLDLVYIGITEEYYELLQPIISSYCCGYFYPAMTSAGALGERILNRLVIKLRDYFKSSKHYKKIYRKDSFDQWELPTNILKDWGVISNEVANLFLKLKQYRNDSIHYNEGYDFEHNSHDAIKTLAKVIDLQFNYISRTDLFWVFDAPGEILLRTDKVDIPFVKEFVLPHCALIGPYCEPMATPPVKTKEYPLKPFTDEKFIELRKNKDKKKN